MIDFDTKAARENHPMAKEEDLANYFDIGELAYELVCSRQALHTACAVIDSLRIASRNLAGNLENMKRELRDAENND